MKRSLLLFAALLLSSAVHAQSYPNRPVKVIIPWPPGQATDLAARIVGEKLSQQLGQSFVMENRPGAGGSIGSDVVAKATPDGYTLLASSSGPLSIMPNLQKTPYDALKDLTPVSLTAIERQQRPVEIGPAIAKHEPVVALLGERIQIERRGEHGIALLAGFGDLRSRGIGDKR